MLVIGPRREAVHRFGEAGARGAVDLNSIMDNPYIVDMASKFNERNIEVIPAHEKSICVLQNESATVGRYNEMCYLGSQDATTCVIAIIVSESYCTVLHFDNISVHKYGYIESALRHTENGASLYLVGGYGFDEDENTSQETVQTLLDIFDRQSQRLTLLLACVLKHNTRANPDGTPVPVFTGVCISLRDSTIHPAKFQDRGPMVTERACRCITAGGTTELCENGNAQITVKPWDFSVDEDDMNMYCKLLHMDSEEFKLAASTSPDAENGSFVKNTKKALALLVNKPSSAEMFGDGQTRVLFGYEQTREPFFHFSWNGVGGWNGGGGWQRVPNKQPKRTEVYSDNVSRTDSDSYNFSEISAATYCDRQRQEHSLYTLNGNFSDSDNDEITGGNDSDNDEVAGDCGSDLARPESDHRRVRSESNTSCSNSPGYESSDDDPGSGYILVRRESDPNWVDHLSFDSGDEETEPGYGPVGSETSLSISIPNHLCVREWGGEPSPPPRPWVGNRPRMLYG